MKRVGLFLGVNPTAGGMFQYARAVLDALHDIADAGFSVQIAYVGTEWAKILKQYNHLQSVQLPDGDAGLRMASWMLAACLPLTPTRMLSRLNPIRRHLARMECDIWIFPAQDAIAYQLGLPFIVSIHDLMHRYERRFPEAGGGLRYWIREHRFSSLARTASAILVDSQFGKEQVIESYGASPEKIHPLPYVPPGYIYMYSDAPPPYDLPTRFFFYPAQFWPHKNHGALLAAAASLKAEGNSVKLVFAGGKGTAYDSVVKKVTALGLTDDVQFLGYVPEHHLRGIYERARALIMPTAFGPTNIPPLEAFVCGCPVAVSRIYGMPEQVGDAALLFDPENHEEITHVLRRLWNDDQLCLELSERGLERARSAGPKQFTGQLQTILGQALADSSQVTRTGLLPS